MLIKIKTFIYTKENKETIWSFASKGFAAVFFILLDVFLARKLQVGLYGQWTYLFSSLTIVFTISYFGVALSSQTFVARQNHKEGLAPVIKSSLILRLLVSLVFVLLIVVLRTPLANLIQRPEFAVYFLYAAPLIFFMGFSEYLKNVFIGLHRVKYHLIVNIFEFGLKYSLAILFLNLLVKLESVLAAFSLAAGVSAIVGLLILRNIYRGHPPKNELVPQFFKEIFQYSLPLFFISLGFLFITELNTQMLGLLTTGSEIAIFGVGKNLVNKLIQIPFALSMGTMPRFAQIEKDKITQMRRKFFNLLRTNSLILAPIILGLLLFTPLVIPLVYGDAYKDAALPLQILLGWVTMSAFNIFFSRLLDYQGKAKRRVLNFTITITINILLNLYLIPLYGAVGAASATSIAYIPYFLLNLLEVRRIFREN